MPDSKKPKPKPPRVGKPHRLADFTEDELEQFSSQQLVALLARAIEVKEQRDMAKARADPQPPPKPRLTYDRYRRPVPEGPIPWRRAAWLYLQFLSPRVVRGILIGVSLTCFSIAVLYLGLARCHARLVTEWGQVMPLLDQRYALLPDRITLLRTYAPQEDILFAKLARSYGAWTNRTVRKPGQQALLATQMELVVRQLQLVEVNYPGLQKDPVFVQLQQRLTVLDRTLDNPRTDYNAAVRTMRQLTVFIPDMFASRFLPLVILPR